jgi:signal transduction histidine kinase
VDQAIEELSHAIINIRTAVFDLHPRPAHPLRLALRAAVLELVDATARRLGFHPRIELRGPLDTDLGAEVVDQLLITLREALAHIGPQASAIDVQVSLLTEPAPGRLSLEVTDDGTGPAPAHLAGDWLAVLRRSVTELGGCLRLTRTEQGGRRLHWSLPVAAKRSAGLEIPGR